MASFVHAEIIGNILLLHFFIAAIFTITSKVICKIYIIWNLKNACNNIGHQT